MWECGVGSVGLAALRIKFRIRKKYPPCFYPHHPSYCLPLPLRLRTEEDADDEILSAVVVKNGRKVVAGTQSGVLNIYSWGAMKDCSDRCGHHRGVDLKTCDDITF